MIVRKINYPGTKMKQPPWINVLYPSFTLVAAFMCMSLILPIPYYMFVALQPTLNVLSLLILLAFFYCLLTLFLDCSTLRQSSSSSCLLSRI